MRRSWLIAPALLVALGLWGCDDGEPARCTPGATQGCVCADGASGAQTCDESGAAFGACTCAPDADGATDRGVIDRGRADATSDAAPDAGDAGADAGADAGPPDAGPFDAAPQCGVDGDCPGAQRCEAGVCVEPAVCAADVDCLGPRLCVRDACADPCASDDGCRGTRTCVDRRCVESDVCVDPTDCDPGRVCADGICDDACGVNRVCPDGQICGDDGLCAEDPDGCVDDSGCLAERLCVADVCADPCLEDAACPGNRACVDGVCPEADPCLVPEDCDPERQCVDGACRPECGPGRACPDPLVCDADRGACRPDDGCAGDADCAEGTHCAEARCVSACADDADCPGSRPCDRARGRCLEADPCLVEGDCDPGRVCEAFRCVTVCDADDDCPGSQTCAGGRCVEPDRCADDADCLGARTCQGGVCADACVDDCPGAQRCVDARCVGADPCGDDLDCPGAERCRGGSCRLPDCAVSADCPAGVCLDAVCVPAPPFTCGDAAPCPPAQACTPAGVCAPAGLCLDDLVCPGRAPICDGIGRCVACAVDAHCPAAERCDDTRCVPDGACAADADCPGARVCLDGICLPNAGCVDDALGDARPPAALDARAYGGLMWCDDTLDRYRIEIPADEGRIITVRHAGLGDLALEVTAAGDPATVIARDDGPHGFDRVALPVADEPRAVDVRVTGRGGFDTPYAIVVDAIGPDDCPPDAHEGVTGNDRIDRATPLPDDVDRVELTLCPGDADWFALNAAVGIDWRFRIEPAEPVAVAATLHDPGGFPVARTERVDGALVVLHGPTADGLYRLELSELGGPTPVTLTLDRAISPEAAARACLTRPRLDPGAPLPVRPTLDRFGIGCGDGPDAVAHLRLPAPTRIDLTLEGSADPLASALALRRGCPGGGDLLCVPGDAIRGRLLPAGDYAIIAKAPPGGDPRLRLTVPDPCAADVDCGDGARCVGGLCQDDCLRDDDCPGSQTCVAARCTAPDRCVDDGDCPGLTACEAGACVPFECSTHDDCPGLCVDRRCADGVPVQCDPGACAGALICASGACVTDGPCAADDDCAPGAPRCDASGDCLRCLGDTDCEGNGICDGGRCSYGGFCFAPEQCPGDRTCDPDGVCAPAPCDGDAYDGLPLAQRPPVLDRRAYTGLVRCDGTTDTYRALLADDEGLRVELRHDPAAGDLRLRLTDADGRARDADTPFGAEVLAVGPGAGRVDIAVDGAPGASTPYSLTLTALDADDCPPDPSEGLRDNDAPARATPIALEPRPLGLCPDDVDHLALDLDAGTRILLDATWDAGGAGVDLALLDPAGAVVADAERLDGGDLRLDAALAEGGRHIARFTAGEAPAEGTLSVVAVAAEDGAALACAAAPTVEPGAPLALPRRAPVDRFTLSCGRGRETEYVAAFDLAAPAVVDIELEGDPIGAAFSVRGDCADGAGEATCVERRVEGLPLAAGRWFVIVETGPTLGPPALRVTARAP